VSSTCLENFVWYFKKEDMGVQTKNLNSNPHCRNSEHQNPDIRVKNVHVANESETVARAEGRKCGPARSSA